MDVKSSILRTVGLAGSVTFSSLLSWASLSVASIGLLAPWPAHGQVAGLQKPTKAEQKAALSYPEAVEEATRNVPPAGYASMYILRQSSVVGMAGCFVLEMDKTIWGGLGNGQYSWDTLTPGQHSFRRTINGTVSLTAEPGQTYYVVISPGGIATGGVRFVSAMEGEKIRRKLSLNPDHWLLRQYLANWASVRVGMTLDEVQHLVRMSEGHTITKIGGDKNFVGRTWDGNEMIIEVGRTQKQFDFRSMLGYSLIFVDGILAEKRDRGGRMGFPGVDSRGCQGPAIAP